MCNKTNIKIVLLRFIYVSMYFLWRFQKHFSLELDKLIFQVYIENYSSKNNQGTTEEILVKKTCSIIFHDLLQS